MPARSARRSPPAPQPETLYAPPRCSCACARHPRAAELDAELRLLGTRDCPPGMTLSAVAARHGIDNSCVAVHRRKHLGLRALPKGRPAVQPPLVPRDGEAQDEARRAPLVVQRAEQRALPPTPEGHFAQLVKTVSTLIALGSYRGISTVRALAARHGVSEEEVLRAHRRASQSVRDARGGLREQLELSVGVLTQVRDQERQVAEDYTGIAQRIVQVALPGTGGAPPQRQASQDELERARTARSIAAQAQDNAIAAQKQIDQNTIHRRAAPLVQVSFSASPDFGKAHEAFVLVLGAFVGPEREEAARAAVARGLQLLEDGGENLDAPEFLEYLAELRQDARAVTAEGEAAE